MCIWNLPLNCTFLINLIFYIFPSQNSCTIFSKVFISLTLSQQYLSYVLLVLIVLILLNEFTLQISFLENQFFLFYLY